MLDYYALRSELKASLLKYLQQMDVSKDPLGWAWLAHAFSLENPTNNPVLKQIVEQAKSWLDSEAARASDAHLGAIGLLCSVFQTMNDMKRAQIIPELIQRTENLMNKGLGKFARLNDPDVIYGIALGVRTQWPQHMHHWLKQHCEQNAQSTNWRRALLFAAATFELQGTAAPFMLIGSQLGAHEIIIALWFVETYPHLVLNNQSRLDLWEAFEIVADGISYDLTAEEGGILYTASPIDVAMLYEATIHETRETNPVVIFNNMQLHQDVRGSAGSLFTKGEYVMAVFQAAVTFIDTVKQRANHPTGQDGRPLDGAALMAHVFGSKTPRLKFNQLQTQADRDEQRGLALLAEGIVAAVRNPKGHTPQNAIHLSAHDALEQLAIISYLAKRLDSAKP